MRRVTIIILMLLIFTLGNAGTLFVGLEGSAPPTYSTDLNGFPSVTWSSNFSFDVSGAAATPGGVIYLIEGGFTTHLYQATLTSSPQQICTISEDMSSLAYGRNTLWGFSNYADTKGIYSIDPNTGFATLVLDVYTNNGYRFFALDYNPVDDLLYGYTEYGNTGLYSINIDTGEMIFITGPIPASNAQGRGMAIGNNTVYLTATRGDDGIPYYAYDLSQGAGGSWQEFTNPYPNYHSTGGAAWIPEPVTTSEISGHIVGSDQPEVGLENCEVNLTGVETYQTSTDANGQFVFPTVEQNNDYVLQITKDGYDIYSQNISVGIENIDLGTIVLNEITSPATNLFASVNENDTIVNLSWEAPAEARQLEDYAIYRFLEANNQNPEIWDFLSSVTTTAYTDSAWSDLEPNIYQYAVVARYTNDLESEATLSNAVEKLPVGIDTETLNSYNGYLNNYPNPFNPTTTISFVLPERTEQVKLEIYNIQGQLIRKWNIENINKGKHSLVWNGKNETGKNVSSGIYFYKLTSDKYTISRKMLMLK